MSNIEYCGIAIGTHARSIVQEHVDTFIKNEDFYEDILNLKAAVEISKNLVNTI